MQRFLLLLLALTSYFCLGASSCTPAAPSGGSYITGGVARQNDFGRGPNEKETSDFMKKDTVSYWEGDGVQGSPGVTIDLSQQRAYFYKGGKLVGISMISSGTDAYATPTGNFKITQKSRHHESNLYGDYVWPDGTIAAKDIDTSKDPKPPGTKYDGADMPYFMRFHGGVGMHGGFLPGFPDSHGCVRMPEPMAAKFYQNVSIGTPVKVIR